MRSHWTVWGARVRVSLPPSVSDRQRRELSAFARYCARRIERELGTIEGWMISLVAGGSLEYASVVSVSDAGTSVEARGIGDDAALTIWDAMCRLEQALRDRRPRPKPRMVCATA